MGLKIANILPNTDRLDVVIRIVKVLEHKEIPAHGIQKIVRCVAGDDTGVILLILWNKDIEFAVPGNIVRITAAASKRYKDEKQLTTTRDSKIELLNDDPVFDLFTTEEEIVRRFLNNA